MNWRELEAQLQRSREEVAKLGVIADDDPRWVVLTPDMRVYMIAPNMEEAHRRIAYTNWLSLPIKSAIERKLTFKDGVVDRWFKDDNVISERPQAGGG